MLTVDDVKEIIDERITKLQSTELDCAGEPLTRGFLRHRRQELQELKRDIEGKERG